VAQPPDKSVAGRGDGLDLDGGRWGVAWRGSDVAAHEAGSVWRAKGDAI
jgi:hypothetical protein